MELLGHVVSGEGIKPSPKKLQALRDVKPPKNIRELRGYLGMTGWYRRFIRDYATLARPLTNLTKKECHKNIVAGMQEPEALEAFESLRDALMGPDVVLAHPDFSKRFRVDLDASCEAIGGVLSQEDKEGEWRPIEYLSKKITGKLREDEYAPTHLE